MSPRLVRGDVVTPSEVLVDGGVLIEDGRIREVLDARGARERAATMASCDDHRGMTILPGAVDAHVHSFSDPDETFLAATRAAAAGGVTTIIDMPYDEPTPITSRALVEQKIVRIGREASVDVALHGTIAPGSGGAAVAEMVAAGVCGFKVSMFETDPRRFPRIDDAQLREILIAGRDSGVTVGVHAEDGEIIRALVARFRAEGRTAPLDHCRSRPPESETVAIAAGVAIAEAVGAPFHLFHTSTPESVAIIESARARGADISAETCPHYLVLDEDDMERLGAFGKINPPLRSADRVARNWELLAAGGYDMVTSDHAPWSADRKSKPDIFENSSGAPGVQTLLPIILGDGWLGGRMSLLRCASVLAENPARRFNIGHRKGRIEVGLDADLVVYDPTSRTTFTAATQHSRAGWTPYEGYTVPGAVVRTIVRGEDVLRDGELVAEPGTGAFVGGMAA